MTPMIDVMLVLLIIFMIVTPLIAAGFKATLPKGKNLDPRPEGRQRSGAGHRRGRAATSSTAGRCPTARWRTSSAAIFAARTEDKILYFKADNQLKYSQDPGSRGDRPARRRPGHGRHHRAEERRAVPADEDKKEKK